MDNWNRNDQNEYNGITAQRRNRRRTGGGSAEPVRPEIPERPVIPARQENPSGSPAPVQAEGAEEPVITMKPVTAEAETASAETETAAEPEKVTAPESTERPETETAPGTAAEPVVQGPDSRVPPEARRMAAAPYGVPREGAKRPGTRPQVAPKRPPLREERRPVPGPRREVPSPEAMRSGSDRQRGKGPQVNVGYAPGRMNEEATQFVPTADAARESVYGRDAKAYLEKRKQPFRMDEGNDQIPPNRPGHKVLRIIVIALVILGAVLIGLLVVRNRKDDRTGPVNREAPQVFSFDAPTTEGLIAPVDLTFSAMTEKEVDGIRLRAEGDRDLDTVATFGDNADGKLWMMKMHVETGFNGTVMLQVRRNAEEGWLDTGYTAEVSVSTPLGVEAEPDRNDTGIADPDDDDYYNEDEELTESPGEQATPAPTDQETAVPEAAPTERPEEERDEIPEEGLYTPEPTATPAPTQAAATATPPLTADPAPEANPDLINSITIYTSYTKREKDYNRAAKELIHMPPADEYTKQQLGVLTFRGDNFRRNAAAGRLSSAPKELSVLWQTEAGSARGTNQTYYGFGWTGQPAIARWSTEVRAKSNITEAKIEKSALKEVIIAGLDGAIRFLDLQDGKITRNSIKLGYPMAGTPSLHPRGYPFMTVGQLARKMKAKTGKIGLRQYNLYTQKELRLIDGLDGKYHRPLNDIGSFETSALIDRESDTLITVGTNGMLYLESLGTTFDFNTGVLTISPSIVAMNSRAKGQKSNALLAVESSPAAYDKYVYYADMGGVLRCVDTNTLRPVWAVNTGDSVMAAVALDLTEDRKLNLYTANMLNNRKRGNQDVQIRCLDALSGREIWCTEVGVFKGKKDKGKDNIGAKASPVIGQHGLNDLVYFTVTGLSEDGAEKLGLNAETPAALIALNKDNGRVAWAFALSSRSESSPIALYDKEGNGWILQCEQNGTIHLLEGRTGSRVSVLQLEAEIEASPAAYNNVVVIGTTGKNTSFVYGIEVQLDNAPESESAEQAAEEVPAEAAAEGEAEEAPEDDMPADDAGNEEDNGGDAYEEYEEYEEYDGEGGYGDEEDSGGA